MPRTGKAVGIGLSLGLLLGVPVVVSPASSAPPPTTAGTPAPATPTGPPVTVTLITGDRVTVTGNTASVHPGPGRAGMTFETSRTQGRLNVVPQDAARLVQAGRVDRRLFDVTELIDSGYDDARRDTLPLLLRQRRGAAQNRPSVAGTRLTRDLPAIGAVAVEATKDRAAAVWASLTTGTATNRHDTADGVDKIWLDGQRRTTLDRSVPQIGAPAAHRAGWTGRGVRVAVLDTGVDVTHPDLVGRVAESRDFTDSGNPDDLDGHGTHVAATIGGSGAAAGGYRGVAPEATLLSGKVCEVWGCPESAILAGMQWAAVDQRAAVVNLSIGGTDGPELDPLEEAVNRLTAATGTLFVIAAGNSGTDASVSSPGSADAALTVGAVDGDDALADFSSRGPRTQDGAIKPDVTAPGVDIVAARAAHGQIGTPVGQRHVSLSGTSMATPHAAGAAALLAQQRPDATAAQLKALMMASARAHPEQTAFQQGAGRVDVAAAIEASVTADPPGVSFGQTTWPHDDDLPVDRSVTYHNPGDAPVTLRLTPTFTGPDGRPAPAGMLRLSAEQLTVPAGGQAAVTVTVDTRTAGPDGAYTGRLLARADGVTVTTPLAVVREVESYSLTVDVLDVDATPSSFHRSLVIGLDRFSRTELPVSDTPVTVRLPRGRYAVISNVHTTPSGSALLAQPELTIDRDTRLTVDARRAGLIRTTVPEAGAVPVVAERHVQVGGDRSYYGLGILGPNFTNARVGHLGGSTSAADFVGAIGSRWSHPETATSPYLYAVSERFDGALPNGFVRHYRKRDLAAVAQRFHGGPDTQGLRATGAAQAGFFDIWGLGLPTALPTNRVEYVNAAPGLRWWTTLEVGTTDEHGLAPQVALSSGEVAYQAGRRYRDEWNAPPFGPSLPDEPRAGITRRGDVITVNLPTHSDAHGHFGSSLGDDQHTALYRDGQLVGEIGYGGYGVFAVGPEPAVYRVEVRHIRSFTDLSTEVAAAWTFRSRHVPGDAWVGQPATAVRFTPRLDDTGSAPGGRTWTIPVVVRRQPGAPAAPVTALTVQVSYDGGANWQQARVRRQGAGWVATVRHPAGPGWVSLRADATASDGSRVSQRTIRAYRLR